MSAPDPAAPIASWGDAALEQVCRTEIPGYDPWATALPSHRFDARSRAAQSASSTTCWSSSEGSAPASPSTWSPGRRRSSGTCSGGWTANGLRRYRESLVFVARKNGKTSLAAGLALYLLLCDGEPGGQVLGAAEQSQAALIFRHAMHMVAKHPELSRARGSTAPSSRSRSPRRARSGRSPPTPRPSTASRSTAP